MVHEFEMFWQRDQSWRMYKRCVWLHFQWIMGCNSIMRTTISSRWPIYFLDTRLCWYIFVKWPPHDQSLIQICIKTNVSQRCAQPFFFPDSVRQRNAKTLETSKVKPIQNHGDVVSWAQFLVFTFVDFPSIPPTIMRLLQSRTTNMLFHSRKKYIQINK